jgi:hypothetical protein
VTYVDTHPLFGDDEGDYVARQADASGDLVDLRQDDGVHLSVPGAERLARALLDLIDDEIQAATGAATPSSTSSSTSTTAG